MSDTVFQQKSWSLSDLFPSATSSELEATFGEIEKKIFAFEAVREKLTDALPTDDFMGYIRQQEEIALMISRLSGFAALWFTENTQNQAAQTLVARVDQFIANMRNRTLFFELWWKALPEASASRLLQASGDYRYWLEKMRQFKPFTLSEPEEKVINIKDVTGFKAINMLYDSMTNRYTFKVNIKGEEKELTRGELSVYARDNDPAVRAQIYQELYRVYGADGDILGQMYQTLARDWRNENVDMRGFASPISVRNLVNDIPDPVVETLLDVSQANAPVFQRYFKLKAKWLGMDKLRRYDVYAPTASQAEKTYAYNDATQLVFDSFSSYDPELTEMAQRVFKQDHLDSEVRKGKMSGAFCATVLPDVTPWVLLNYQGKADDVATMAHELGHAIHSMYAAKHSVFTSHPCLPLAETASTFGEMILIDRLLAQETDESVRRDILFRQVDDNYATIMRQIYFALFERQAHDMIYKNASVDELSAAYMENLKNQFGDSVDVSDEFKWEWVSIPHIYNVPFYVYAYSFGQLLVRALYQQYKQEGDAFKPRYRQILSAGGSVAPAALLKNAGIDIARVEFWQGGYDVITEMVKKLEELPVSK